MDSIYKYWGTKGFWPIFIAGKPESFRTDWPKNRSYYASMQAGEFVDFIDCPEDEIIICIDADTIMQRSFTKEEISTIKARLKHNDILSVYGAYPPNTMLQVLKNIGYKDIDISHFSDRHEWLGFPEFTASFMMAKKSIFRKLRDLYLVNFDEMTKITGHHAGTQWLINWVCYNHFKVGILPAKFQCGEWYDGADMMDVIFNHTK